MWHGMLLESTTPDAITHRKKLLLRPWSLTDGKIGKEFITTTTVLAEPVVPIADLLLSVG